MSLYITNLSHETTEADLSELLAQVERVNVTKFGKFAFAYFSDQESAHQAIARLNHTEIKGSQIKLQLASKTEQDNAQNFNYLSTECEMCSEKQFTIYCSCSLIKLCENCFFVHMKLDQFIEHTPISPEAYEMGGHVHKNQEKLRSISNYLKGFYLNENQVVEEIEHYRENAITNIDAAKKAVHDKLETIKERVQK